MSKPGGIVLLIFLSMCAVPLLAGDWQPVTPADLHATAPPEAAGADAIILYHQADYDDQVSEAQHYYRLKILTEAGKSHADVQIQFWKGREDINDVKARTIHPDGSIVEFNGKVYEKTVVKAGNVKVITKAFTLPDVTAGSLIEYRYHEHWGAQNYYAPDWILQEDLFVRKAHFSMRAAPHATLAWTWNGLPKGVTPQRKGDAVTLDIENVPAFVDEDYTPPDRELKEQVDFYYVFGPQFDPKKPADFWKEWGVKMNDWSENFIGHHREVSDLAASLVSPSDNVTEKLRKLYGRVQEFRNTSFETSKTEQELKRAKQKDNTNVVDVLKRGYGDRDELTLLFIALARAAGVDTHPVLVPERDQRFFHQMVPNVGQFDAMVAAVKLENGGTALLDPGTPYCPFGMLAWYKTWVHALELDKKGGTFIQTNEPKPEDAVRVRKADLTLDDAGMLRGTLLVAYGGHEAMRERMEELQTDEAGWKKQLQDEAKGWLPVNAKITMQSIEAEHDGSKPLIVHYTIEMPGVLSSTGKRLFLPSSIFGYHHPFQHADRKFAVLFEYPFEDVDEVAIHLPADLRIDSLPQGHQVAPGFASYTAERDAQGNVLTLKRDIKVGQFYYPSENYQQLRSFYQAVSSADDEQVVAKHVQPNGM